MPQVKLQWYTDDSSQHEQTPVSNKKSISAFRKCKQEVSNLASKKSGWKNVEAYMNFRKQQNDFTLSQISVSTSAEERSENHPKLNKIQFEQQNVVPKTKQAQIQTLTLSLNIIPAYSQKISIRHFNHRKKQTKLRKISNIIGLTIQPTVKPSIKSTLKLQSKIKVESQSIEDGQLSLTLINPISADEVSYQVAEKIESSEKSKKEKKIQKRKQKNELKKSKNLNEKIHFQKFQNNNNTKLKGKEESNNKAKPKTENVKKQNTITKYPPNGSQFKQEACQFPFGGVLRNCKCCGKLITKLCFKCPHLYCKAENCPRKRKKILNQKMLQRMKQQKIEQHYRQRELYQKMKNQQGQNFNPRLIEQMMRKQRIEKQIQYPTRKSNRINQNKADQTSIEFQETFTSEEELESKQVFDSEDQQETNRQKNKKHINYQQKDKRQIMFKVPRNGDRSSHSKSNKANPNKSQKVAVVSDNKKEKKEESKKLNEIKNKQIQEQSESILDSFSLSDFETRRLTAKKQKQRKLTFKNEKKCKVDLYLDQDE